MVLTRSSAKITNMFLSQKIREYFQLAKSLATNEVLEVMFKKLKKEIIHKFEERLDKQNRKTDKLEGKTAIQTNAIDQLIIKRDVNELYSRRSF